MEWDYKYMKFAMVIIITHPHNKVISPGQEHDSCVVLFEVRQIKVQKHIHDHKVHVQRRQVGDAKQTEYVDRNKDTRVRVQSVVKELS